jgi:hypothetical protein
MRGEHRAHREAGARPSPPDSTKYKHNSRALTALLLRLDVCGVVGLDAVEELLAAL